MKAEAQHICLLISLCLLFVVLRGHVDNPLCKWVRMAQSIDVNFFSAM